MRIPDYAKNIFLDILFPSLCFGCGKSGKRGLLICESCSERLAVQTAFFCSACGRRLPEAKRTCHRGEAFAFGAAGIFGNEPMTGLVKLLKYKRFAPAGEILGEILARFAKNAAYSSERKIVIPVPLSARRLRERGFNQSGVIAESFLRHSGGSARLSAGLLARTRDTQPQTEMASAEERRKNVAGCFSAVRPEEVAGESVILIDDVFTSGATLGEAARTLKKAGAAEITALVVLRAQ